MTSIRPETEGSQISGVDATEVQHEEHGADVERMAHLFGPARWLILLFVAVDLIAFRLGHYGSIFMVLPGRLAIFTLVFLVHRRLKQRPIVSPRWLRRAEMAIFGGSSVTMALACAETGGLDSAAMQSMTIVLIAQVFVMPVPYVRGAQRLGFSMAVFLVTYGVLVSLRPALAAQLHSPPRLIQGALALSTVLFCAALLVIGGHGFWLARHRVIATRTAGRYILRDRIGSGGMGNVWRAYHPALKHDVAVKILRADRMTPAMVMRFEREIIAMTNLSHPNTVRVVDCGATESGLLYFVMELISGDTLKQLVKREGPLPPARAIHIVRQAARALAEAHGRGIIHRDIKPDNILITSIGGEKDFVKVLDFGIAKQESPADDDEALTQAGTVVGTPAYLSPEQATGNFTDARSDIYSLGAVLFFALTGRPPFEGPMSRQIFAHLAAPAPVPSEVVKDFVHPALDEVVRTCLAKEPARRYAMALELDGALRNVPVSKDEIAPWSPEAPDRAQSIVDRDCPTVRSRRPPLPAEPLTAIFEGAGALAGATPTSPEETRIVVRPSDRRDALNCPPTVRNRRFRPPAARSGRDVHVAVVCDASSALARDVNAGR